MCLFFVCLVDCLFVCLCLVFARVCVCLFACVPDCVRGCVFFDLLLYVFVCLLIRFIVVVRFLA